MAAESAGEVIFRVGEDANNSDIWDDTALIEAYDRAVNSLKDGNGGGNKKKSGTKTRKQKNFNKRSKGSGEKTKGKTVSEQQTLETQWQVGDTCAAVFTEDELIYDAVILSIDKESNTCFVRYDYYGNKEEQYLDDLLPSSRNEVAEYSPKVLVGDVDDVANSPHHSKSGNIHSDMEWTAANQSPLRWAVSDLCCAPELPSGHLHQAVINSFPTPCTCRVTFIRSRQSQEVHTSSLQPSQGIKHTHRCLPQGDQLAHGHPSHHTSLPVPGLQPFSHNLPMMPPFTFPASPQASVFPSALPQMMNIWPPSVHRNQTAMTNPHYLAPMPPPPPPVSSKDLGGDDEALASMLMAWYLSGYHTGYYQALQQHRQGASHKPTSTQHKNPQPEECVPDTSKQRTAPTH